MNNTLIYRGSTRNTLRRIIQISQNKKFNSTPSISLLCLKQNNNKILNNNQNIIQSQSIRMMSTAPADQHNDMYDDDHSTSTKFKSMVDIFEESAIEFADRPALGTRVDDEFQYMNYNTLARDVQKFRNVLSHHDISINDKVTIISNNRVEWVVAWYAAVSLGAQIVPMYEAQAEKDWRFIVNDSDSKLIIAATDSIYQTVKGYIGNVGNVQNVLVLDAHEDLLNSYSRWMRTVENEEPVPAIPLKKDDVATIIYTSGTTGNPKGVELSQNNIVSNLMALKKIWKGELNKDNVALAFLPWAHVFGQTAELHSAISNGAALGIVPNREQILESFQLIKPTVLVSVPALFNRIYDAVNSKISQASPLKQKIFHTAKAAKRAYNEDLEFGRQPGILTTLGAKLADKVVFSKIRETFGGRLRWSAAGGAATSMEVAQFFEDIGIPICEGYGLTETSPVITSCSATWEYRRLGCSGVALEGVDLRIINPSTLEQVPNGEEGEVTCAGPNVMIGYRNNPKANKEVFYYKDGKKFFRTGDLGRILDDKFLKITGRIKEQYKLENGKYVVPAPLEDMICRSRFVLQSFIYGDNKPHNICLVVPDMVELNTWAKGKGLIENDIPAGNQDAISELLSMDEVISLLADEISYASRNMKGFERPTRWSFVPEPFTQENQMLTPKMSLRRKGVMEAYSDKVEDVYSNNAGYLVNQ